MKETSLNRELCFQLYVASKEVIKRYKPYLEQYDLTYTGFIAMLAIENEMSVNELGEELYLDSGTLSPLLKKLGNKGYIIKQRSANDERRVELFLTKKGTEVKAALPCVSKEVAQSMSSEEVTGNYDLLLTQLIQLNQLFKN